MRCSQKEKTFSFFIDERENVAFIKSQWMLRGEEKCFLCSTPTVNSPPSTHSFVAKPFLFTNPEPLEKCTRESRHRFNGDATQQPLMIVFLGPFFSMARRDKYCLIIYKAKKKMFSEAFLDRQNRIRRCTLHTLKSRVSSSLHLWSTTFFSHPQGIQHQQVFLLEGSGPGLIDSTFECIQVVHIQRKYRDVDVAPS